MNAAIRTSLLGTALVCAMLAQKTSNENQVRDRGRTPTADDTQTLDRGRMGRQGAVPAKPLTLHGLLVDASCLDRSTANLSQPPANSGTAAAQTANRSDNGGVAAHGVNVDSKTLDSERADAMEHQVPDLRSRMSDPSCAVTGNTRGLALLTDNGRLLNLNEGGNTMAIEKIQGSPAGRAMISGTGPALKPKATVVGIIHGDRLEVSKIVKMEEPRAGVGSTRFCHHAGHRLRGGAAAPQLARVPPSRGRAARGCPFARARRLRADAQLAA